MARTLDELNRIEPMTNSCLDKLRDWDSVVLNSGSPSVWFDKMSSIDKERFERVNEIAELVADGKYYTGRVTEYERDLLESFPSWPEYRYLIHLQNGGLP